MKYQVLLGSRVRKDIKVFPNNIIKRINQALVGLGNDPRQSAQPLKGRLAGAWRIRIGEYRLLYTIDDQQRIVRVFGVKHRREAYR